MKKTTALIAFAVAATATATIAVAHSGATGVVLERMNGMTAMRDLIRDLAPMMQGSVPYNPIQVSEAGYVIGSHAGETMRTLFPKGSLEGVTYAKPDIWTEWGDFAALADELRVYSAALTKAAPNGLAPLVAAPASTQPDAMVMQPSPNSGRSQAIAALMAYTAPQIADAAPVMAAANPVSSLPAMADIGVSKVFEQITGTCSACHSRFRTGRN
jgi:cytochrome c556